MRFIPVIDLLNGIVVHAKCGKRDEYAPVDSVLSSSAEPIDVINAFNTTFDFEEIYIADLDAIQGGPPNIPLLKRIEEKAEMKVMIDCGIDSAPKARHVIDAVGHKVVVGSETLRELADLEGIMGEIGRDRVLVSVDIKGKKVLSKCNELREKSPKVAAGILENTGVTELIILDLTNVGSERGPATSMIKRIIESVQIPVIVGGGIRNTEDILELKRLGVSGVLVATALHKGNIGSEEVDRLVAKN